MAVPADPTPPTGGGRSPTHTSSIPKSADTRRELLGYLLMVCAALAYTVHNVLIRLAETSYPDVSAASSVLIRSAVQTVLSTLWLTCVRPRITLIGVTARHVALLFLRGLLGGIALLLLYISMDHLPVGDATAIFFCTPVFTLALSHAALREPVTMSDVIAAVLSVCGVILITRSSSAHPDAAEKPGVPSSSTVVGVIAAVGAAALTAAAYTVVRALGNAVHFMAYVLSMGACAGFVATVFLSQQSNSHSQTDRSTLLGWTQHFSSSSSVNHQHLTPLVVAALAGFVAQACTNRGLQLCRAGRATLVRNMEVPLTYAVGSLTLSERPSSVSITGATLVVSAAVLVGVRRLMSQ